jgi:hypothetical protein
MKKIIVLLVLLTGLLVSCEPESCWDWETYHYEDGTSETVWIEYEC